MTIGPLPSWVFFPSPHVLSLESLLREVTHDLTCLQPLGLRVTSLVSMSLTISFVYREEYPQGRGLFEARGRIPAMGS
jgi:hypothetical protein